MGAHSSRSRPQHPPHLSTLVHVGQYTTLGSLSGGMTTVVGLTSHTSGVAIMLAIISTPCWLKPCCVFVSGRNIWRSAGRRAVPGAGLLWIIVWMKSDVDLTSFIRILISSGTCCLSFVARHFSTANTNVNTTNTVNFIITVSAFEVKCLVRFNSMIIPIPINLNEI